MMKRSVKANSRRGATRDLFAELSEGHGSTDQREAREAEAAHSCGGIQATPEALAQKPFEEIVEPIARSFDKSGMSEEELDDLITKIQKTIREERRQNK